MEKPNHDRPQQSIEIGSSSPRWVGIASWLLILLVVGGVLTWLHVRLTRSVWLAAGLVTFMLAYMLIMGYWASLRGRRP